MDNLKASKRSEVMSHIKSKDTHQEILVRSWLFRKGYRFRKNYKLLPGKPDIVFTRKKIVVFINGCFWHGHEGCKYYRIPKTNTLYWSDKINKNVKRDLTNYDLLEKMGWKVVLIWECDLKSNFEMRCEKLLNELQVSCDT